jgi:hypothetical protein
MTLVSYGTERGTGWDREISFGPIFGTGKILQSHQSHAQSHAQTAQVR